MNTSENESQYKIINVPTSVIDIEILEVVKTEVDEILDSGIMNIIMNFANLEYLSSIGLGLLVYTNNKCNDQGGNFAVCCLRDNTLDMMKLTKLDTVINIFKTEEDALEAFKFLN